MDYIVLYMDDNGRELTQGVSAQSREEVIALSGIEEYQIISIDPIKKGFSFKKNKVNLDDQGIVLTALASAQSSGKNAITTLSSVLNESGYNYTPSPEADTLSKQLRELHFHELVVLVVDSGTESGKLGEALSVAAHEVDRLIAQSSNLASESKFGVIYHLIGLALLFIAPIMANSIVGPMVESGTISLPEFSKIVFDLYDINNAYTFWVLPAVIVLTLIFRIEIFTALRNIKVLNLPYRWIINRRAIQFNLAMDILISSGYSTKVVPQKMLTLCKKHERVIYQSMIESVESGSTVSAQITKQNWPFLYVMAISGFENNILDSQRQIITNATSMLVRSDASLSSQIATILSLTGLMSAGFGIFLLAGGIILPMMSMSL